MKHFNTFENFLYESSFNNIAYHTSGTKISSFKPAPVWVTANPVFAKAYHSNSIDEDRDAFTYEVRVSGNMLSQDEARKLSEVLGINFDDIIDELTAQPDVKDRIKLVKPFIGKCDGFFHWDYDPRDWGDGESLLVFNPQKNLRIVKQMNY